MKINGKCSWNSSGKLPDISLLNPYWKSIGNAPELPGPIIWHFFIKSLLNVKELLWSIPSGLLIKSLLKINEKCSWNSMAPIPLYFFIKSSLKTNGKCAWISPSQFHGICLLNPYSSGASLVYSLRFAYKILIEDQWKMLLELHGANSGTPWRQFLCISLLNPHWKPMENAPGSPRANSMEIVY